MADSKANGVAVQDYPFVFSGRVTSARTLTSKQSGNQFGIVALSGALVDPSTGFELLYLPSYELLVEPGVADAVRVGRCEVPARLEARQNRDGRFVISLALDL